MGKRATKLFDELKRSWTQAPLLRSSEPYPPYEVTTDASDTGIEVYIYGETHAFEYAPESLAKQKRTMQRQDISYYTCSKPIESLYSWIQVYYEHG